MSSLGPVDPDRLTLFKYAIVTVLDKDGFPFSVATDFHMSSNGEILMKKPNVPIGISGKQVGVLFNHISAIPTGGYTDRRYMLVWGVLTEKGEFLVLHPESVSEWDEKILPFDQLCMRAVPQGQKYLQSLQPSIEA